MKKKTVKNGTANHYLHRLHISGKTSITGHSSASFAIQRCLWRTGGHGLNIWSVKNKRTVCCN